MLNQHQKIALWVGVAVAGAMLLYPPWSVTAAGNHIYLGYSPLIGHAGRVEAMLSGDRFLWEAAGVDPQLLLLQWGFVAMVTGAAIVTLKSKGEVNGEG